MILELVEAAMGHVVLISGPPGCGKTSWALKALQDHVGPCAYLRLEEEQEAGLEQGEDSGIDLSWLKDQIPRLEEVTPSNAAALKHRNDALTLIEVQRFHTPSQGGINGYGINVRSKLDALELQPDQVMHFGRDPELPSNDTLEFSKLEVAGIVDQVAAFSTRDWPPVSLSTMITNIQAQVNSTRVGC